MSANNIVKPHTIKKFELIESYVTEWIYKLMNNDSCKEIVFIDCMCNSGIYSDENGNRIEGTPIRVAKIIDAAARHYTSKKASLYFNDLSEEKISTLKVHLPEDTKNFHIHTSCGDGNILISDLKTSLISQEGIHYLLFYDPYQADINWNALKDYFFGWGEVIINHMVLDSERAIKQVRDPNKIRRYENTYLMAIEDLWNFGSNRIEYEKRVNDIIKNFRSTSDKKYYIATFPFFNRANGLIYDIIFFTNSRKGFTTFKTAAWKTFGGKSSNKNTHGKENQVSLFVDIDPAFSSDIDDEYCYNLNSIAEYLVKYFKSRKGVPLAEIWNLLELHPIFPSSSYRNKIKTELKRYGCTIKASAIDFS